MNTSLRVCLIDDGRLRSSIGKCYKLRQFTFIVVGGGYTLSGSDFTNTHNILQLVRKLKLKILIVCFQHTIFYADR